MFERAKILIVAGVVVMAVVFGQDLGRTSGVEELPVGTEEIEFLHRDQKIVDLDFGPNIEAKVESNLANKLLPDIAMHLEGDLVEGEVVGDFKELVARYSVGEVTNIDISHTVGGSTFAVQIGACGINGLIGIKVLAYEDSIGGEEPVVLKSPTDWVGPYMVEDLRNGFSKETAEFTGGWHGKKVGEDERPTAKSVSLSVVMDGDLAEPDEVYVCKEVVIETVNEINGFDTDYPVLKEKVIYSVRGRMIHVQVVGEAMSDVRISRYYGFQSQNGFWTGNVSYIYEEGGGEVYPTNLDSQSSNKKKEKINEVLLTAPDDKYNLKLRLDNTVGLGKLVYLGDDVPLVFTKGYGKTYFNLVNGIDLVLSEGETYSWEGTYIFEDK